MSEAATFAASSIQSTGTSISTSTSSPTGLLSGPSTLLTTIGPSHNSPTASATSSTSSTTSTPSSTHPPFHDYGQGSIGSPVSEGNTAGSHLEEKEGLLKYYFVIIALFIILFVLVIWFLHRRKKRAKETLRNSSHNALARDVDGWINTRRWIHGGWRSPDGGMIRREEGLNEFGEAPPPYEPSPSVARNSNGHGAGNEPHSQGLNNPTAPGLTIPLRTLSRNGRAVMKPPEYQETARPLSSDASTRPNTSSRPGHSSTTALVPPDNHGTSEDMR